MIHVSFSYPTETLQFETSFELESREMVAKFKLSEDIAARNTINSEIQDNKEMNHEGVVSDFIVLDTKRSSGSSE